MSYCHKLVYLSFLQDSYIPPGQCYSIHKKKKNWNYKRSEPKLYLLVLQVRVDIWHLIIFRQCNISSIPIWRIRILEIKRFGYMFKKFSGLLLDEESGVDTAKGKITEETRGGCSQTISTIYSHFTQKWSKI